MSVCTLLVDLFSCKRFWDWFTQSWIQRSPEDFCEVLSTSACISRDENYWIWPTLLSTPYWNHSLFKLIHITNICFVIACKSPWEVWNETCCKSEILMLWEVHCNLPEVCDSLTVAYLFWTFLHKICWYERELENPLGVFHREKDGSFFLYFPFLFVHLPPQQNNLARFQLKILKLKLHIYICF